MSTVLWKDGDLEKINLITYSALDDSFAIYNIENEATVGRLNSPMNPTVQLNSPIVSRLQGRIFKNYGLFVYEDNMSSNGTYINGTLFGKNSPENRVGSLLKTGDVLRIDNGDYRHPSPKAIVMVVTRDTGATLEARRVDLSNAEDITIGREVDGMQIDNDMVSATHAIFARNGENWYVEDLDSTNGVYVNNERINRRKDLYPMDVVRIVEFEFLYTGRELLYFSEEDNRQYSDVNGNEVEAPIEPEPIYNEPVYEQQSQEAPNQVPSEAQSIPESHTQSGEPQTWNTTQGQPATTNSGQQGWTGSFVLQPVPTSEQMDAANVPFPVNGQVSVPFPEPQSVPEQVYEPAPEPVYEPEPWPLHEPVSQPVYEPEPQPVYQTTPQPIYQTTPQPIYQPEPQPVYQPEPQPSYQPQPVPQPAPVPAPAPAPARPQAMPVQNRSNSGQLVVKIRERSVRKALKKQVLLKDINICVNPGELVMLLGGSGAGKTTFINAVMGYEKADGTIIHNNVDVYKDYSKVRKDIGFVPQQDLLRLEDTVYKTLENAADMKLNVSAYARNERIEKVLNSLGLSREKDSKVKKLSGGQRKRLSIAVELISDPSLFFLDEPDSGLDGIMARSLMEQLRTIADEGKIVMVITHAPDRVKDLFNKVIVLAKGSRDNIGRLAYFGGIQDAMRFFDTDSLEGVIKRINREDEGGDGKADYYISKYEKGEI